MSMTRPVWRAAPLLALILVSATANADSLWSRAVGYYETYRNLMPGHMTIRFDQYNGRGNLVSSDYSEIVIEIGPGGEIQSRTVFAESNGRDVTDERSGQTTGTGPFGGGDDSADSPFAGLMVSPFDPDLQEQVVSSDTGRVEYLDGVPARVHIYQQKTSEDNGTTGTVWIDADTGAPIRLTARIDSLPGNISTFEMIQDFQTDGEGRWYVSRMQFTGEGNILFIRRRIESEFQFSNYFPAPAESLN